MAIGCHQLSLRSSEFLYRNHRVQGLPEKKCLLKIKMGSWCPFLRFFNQSGCPSTRCDSSFLERGTSCSFSFPKDTFFLGILYLVWGQGQTIWSKIDQWVRCVCEWKWWAILNFWRLLGKSRKKTRYQNIVSCWKTFQSSDLPSLNTENGISALL